MNSHAYLLRCSDSSYYAGHTDELERRIADHQAGVAAEYTRHRRPVDLVWSKAFATRDEAAAAEIRIERSSRSEKEALTRGGRAALQTAVMLSLERAGKSRAAA